MQASSFFVGNHKTPAAIKWLIIITISLSVLSPIATYFLEHFFQIPGPGAWLSLSREGLLQGWLWQPLTYFFLHSAGVGISLSLLISLLFHMAILWFTASDIDFRYGSKATLALYLSAGLFAGLVSTLALFLFSSPAVIVGSGPAVWSLLMVWTMLYPDLDLFFFFLIKVKAKWLVALFLGFALLINLSYGSFVPFLADLAGIIYGFLVGLFIMKLPNPYPLNLDFKSAKAKKKHEEKIIDISVFQESDDAFMDRMLDKVAKEGEGSLSQREKERMQKISQNKKY